MRPKGPPPQIHSPTAHFLPGLHRPGPAPSSAPQRVYGAESLPLAVGQRAVLSVSVRDLVSEVAEFSPAVSKCVSFLKSYAALPLKVEAGAQGQV